MSFIITQAAIKASRVPPEPKKKVYKHTAKLIRSAQQFPENFKDLESTKHAEAMHKPTDINYEVKPEYG